MRSSFSLPVSVSPDLVTLRVRAGGTRCLESPSLSSAAGPGHRGASSILEGSRSSVGIRLAYRAPAAAKRRVPCDRHDAVVGVAQLVELLVVVQAVAGSSPVAHPLRTRRTQGDGRRSGRQDAVHHGREPRDRPRDRRARRAGRRQRRPAGEDGGAAPEAAGHHLHGGGGDRGGRRDRAADRRRRARPRLGGGRRRARRAALRRDRHPRQQRERDLADADRADGAQALRPDAEHQRARHLPRHPRGASRTSSAPTTATSSRSRRRSTWSRAGSAATPPTRSRSTA